MSNSVKNHGLSDAMIAVARAILEKKLTPKQEKNIDKNHNGKIDKGDFDILHKKKEEVKQIDELTGKGNLKSMKAHYDKQKTKYGAAASALDSDDDEHQDRNLGKHSACPTFQKFIQHAQAQGGINRTG